MYTLDRIAQRWGTFFELISSFLEEIRSETAKENLAWLFHGKAVLRNDCLGISSSCTKESELKGAPFAEQTLHENEKSTADSTQRRQRPKRTTATIKHTKCREVVKRCKKRVATTKAKAVLKFTVMFRQTTATCRPTSRLGKHRRPTKILDGRNPKEQHLAFRVRQKEKPLIGARLRFLFYYSLPMLFRQRIGRLRVAL